MEIMQRRLSRRLLLTDLGRAGFGIAILGACSGGSPSATPARPIESDPDDTEPSASSDGELDWQRVPLGNVSAYVLVRGRRAAVVDTGNPGSAPAILDALQTLDVGWTDVDHVVLTHHHPDHIGSVDDVLAGATAATAYAGNDDIASITSSRPLRGVGDGDEIFGLQVIHTPGHTPGSISLLDGATGLLVAGDALNGDGGRVVGPNESFTPDMSTANASVVKLAGFDFATAVFGHGDPVEGDAGTQVDELAAALG